MRLPLLLAAILLLIPALPSLSYAQPRVEPEVVQDLSFIRRLGQKGGSAIFDVGSWGGVDAATGVSDQPTTGRADLFVGSTLGAVASRTTRVFIDSFVQLPLTFGEDTELGMPTGTHTAEARLGLITRDADGKRHGFEVFATADVDHGGDYFGVRPAMLGSGDYVLTQLSTGIVPKFQFFEEAPIAFTFPVSYELIDATWLNDDALSEGTTSHGVEAGMGFELRLRSVLQGRFNLVQVRHDRVSLEGTSPDSPTGLQRTVVEGLEYEGSVLQLDDLLVNIEIAIGGGFIKDSRGRETDSVIGRLGTALDAGTWGFGGGYKRDITWSGDGQRHYGDNRVDVSGHISPELFGLGIRSVLALSLLDDLMIEDHASARLAFNTEVFLDPFDGGELGVFYNTAGGKVVDNEDWDIARAGEGWNHEAGVFLRWTGEL